jgi:hypothetical protein
LILLLAAFFLASPALSFDGGDGTSSDPYEVKTCQQLQDIKNDLDAHYELVGDVNCSETSTWNSGKGFRPIGDNSNPFSGVFNGTGHEVSDLYIDRTTLEDLGLFGELDNGGKVTFVGATNADIEGTDSSIIVGIIAGDIYDGTVSKSYTTGQVFSQDEAGGIAGVTRDTGAEVVNSYSHADAAAVDDNDIGGLIGQMNGGTISNSFSTGTVDSTGGGLIGLKNDASVADSYWDTQSSGLSSSDGGTGLMTSEMQGDNAESNMNLDFSGTWISTEGYPDLAWQESGPAICDSRGPLNQCIASKTHDISSKSFNILTIFEAKESSFFKALEGLAHIKVSNSSTLSGLWRGSFNISTDKPRIKPGAEFEPLDGHIVIDSR